MLLKWGSSRGTKTRDTMFQEPTRPIILNKSKKPGTEESLAWKMIVRRIEEKDTFVRDFFFFLEEVALRVLPFLTPRMKAGDFSP